MLLQKPVERAATGTAVQPDRDFVRGSWIVGRKEPEEELVLICGVAIDRQCPGIRLANVKVDFRYASAIDLELYAASVSLYL